MSVLVDARIDPGVYHGMPAAEYHETPGLSNSAMKDLAVSSLRYWHLHVNPNRPADRETPEMTIGTALHCAVLEPDSFDDRFVCEIEADDFPGCLITMEDLRAWIKSKGGTPKGTRKAEAIAQAQLIDPNVQILDVIQEQHEIATAGKTILTKYDFRRVAGMAVALGREPEVQKVLAKGRAEVSVFANDPDTGVPLKGRMDWVSPEIILDVKTFSQQRGKSIDQCVYDAIWFESYARQAYFYSMLYQLAEGKALPVVLTFCESEDPHEVRIKRITPQGKTPSLLWGTAGHQVKALIRKYADCVARFGQEPWREPQDEEAVSDEEIRQLGYAQ